MAVDSQHPEYQYYYPIWTMIDDFVLGEKQVKAKGINYLPSHPDWNNATYLEFNELAPFTNFTVRTINALLGAMFIKNPAIRLPEPLEYLHENADGKGNGLLQVVRRMSLEAIKKGRSGVYVDFPRVEADEGFRRPAKVVTDGLEASVTFYDAANIINWKEDDTGLVLVVLKEVVETRYYDFEADLEIQYRVLRKIDGVYKVEVWHDFSIIDEYTPRDFNGNTFDFIPFFFNGSVNNEANCDNSPVYEIVSKNKTHYQLEAEIMRNIRLVGSPMMTVSIGDMSAQQFLEINGLGDGSPLKYGASRGLILGAQGSANLLQAQANDMAQTKADNILKEAIMLGARLVTKGGSGRATAEQIRIETSAENAVINSIAKNIEATMQKVLACVSRFMTGQELESQFTMSTEFYAQTADPQVLMFAKEMMMSGLMAPSDMLELLKNNGLLDTNRSMASIMSEARTYLEGYQDEQQRPEPNDEQNEQPEPTEENENLQEV